MLTSFCRALSLSGLACGAALVCRWALRVKRAPRRLGIKGEPFASGCAPTRQAAILTALNCGQVQVHAKAFARKPVKGNEVDVSHKSPNL